MKLKQSLCGNWVVTWKERLEALMMEARVISQLSALTSNYSVSWPVKTHECLKNKNEKKRSHPLFICSESHCSKASQTYHRPHTLAHWFTHGSALLPAPQNRNYVSFVRKYWVLIRLIYGKRVNKTPLEIHRNSIWWY